MIKKYLLLATMLLAFNAFSQCPGTPIELASQSAVDSFVLDYPSCTMVSEGLHIVGSDITNLDGLDVIEAVYPYLTIEATNLTDLSGLEQVTAVGNLTITNNLLLETTSGLEDIHFDFIKVTGNASLTTMAGLSQLSLSSVPTVEVRNNDLLTDLSGLEGVLNVAGLIVNDNLNLGSLAGLDNLEEVSNATMLVRNNANLTTLSGPTNVVFVDSGAGVTTLEIIDNDGLTMIPNNLVGAGSVVNSVFVGFNDVLTSIDGLDEGIITLDGNLTILDNPLLTTCDAPIICSFVNDFEAGATFVISGNAAGCDSFEQIEDSCSFCPSVSLVFNSQADIDNFAIDYPDCSFVAGSVTISGADIVDLSGLSGISSIGEQLTIEDNDMLTTLSGWDEVALLGPTAKITIQDNPLLEELTTFFGVLNEGLILKNLPVLTSLAGFDGVSSTSKLELISCNALSSVSGLQNLAISNELRIENNSDLAGLSDMNMAIGPLEFLQIGNNASLTSFAGLEGLNTTATASVFMYGNIFVTDFDAFTGWTTAPRNLTLESFLSLTSMSGLSSMNGAVEVLSLRTFDSLFNFDGLQGISEVTNLTVRSNGVLTSLLGLEGLSNDAASNPITITIQFNEQLEDISALNNIDPLAVVGLTIDSNVSLSFCSEPLICKVLFAGLITPIITGNDLGCENIDQVISKCTVGFEDYVLEANLSLFPNPSSQQFSIQLSADLQLEKITLYSLKGQVVKTSPNATVDISSLDIGVYFVKIETNKGRIYKRLIKN
ncbi:MAG: T9SS type A sorting domain-containing protein [Gilvibacter sp.]